MTATITPGDLVWVAKPTVCCGRHIPAHGVHFIVSALAQVPEVVQCAYCSCLQKNIVFVFGSRGGGVPLSMVRRVAPLESEEAV